MDKGLNTAQQENQQQTAAPTGIVRDLLAGIAPTAQQMKAEEDKLFASLLKPYTLEEHINNVTDKGDELSTDYILNGANGYEERFTIPCNALTFVVAPTSHGKSTVLQNLALQVLRNKENEQREGTILYFSYEEDKDSVIMQLGNKFVNMDISERMNKTNLRAIREFLTIGNHQPTPQDENTKNEFLNRYNDFFARNIFSDKLTILDNDLRAAQFIRFLEYTVNHLQRKLKAVFVDYMQLIYSDDCNLPRREELKEISNQLNKFAKTYNVPIVCAAQANRETRSPLDMFSQKIADSADLERIANKVLFVWNSAFAPQTSNTNEVKQLRAWSTTHGFTDKNDTPAPTGYKKGKESAETAKDAPISWESGKMFFKLTKNRGGVVNICNTFDYNGNTGVITPATKKPNNWHY